MSPGRVSVREEWQGHPMLMDRKQKRRGNKQRRVTPLGSVSQQIQTRGPIYLDTWRTRNSYRHNRHAVPSNYMELPAGCLMFGRCCFTSTETVRTVRDREPKTATLTFTQLLSSESLLLSLIIKCCLTSTCRDHY